MKCIVAGCDGNVYPYREELLSNYVECVKCRMIYKINEVLYG